MARATRASASSALIVHSEKGFDSRTLDEGRMAHPPFGMPLPCEANYGRLKIVPSSRVPVSLTTSKLQRRWERPPELPRAAFLPRRLAILRGVRRVGAGGRNLQSFQHREPPNFLKITGEAGFGRQASIRDRQPNHGLHRIVRNGSSLSPKTTFEMKLSESDRLVNLISKHYYLSKRRDHVSTRNGRAPAPGGTVRAGRGL